MNKRETISSEEYIYRLKSALARNLSTWFPLDREKRIEMNTRLAHEFGYGIASYDNWEDIIKGTYSTLIVCYSLDSVGVIMDNKYWIQEVTKGAWQYFGYKEE